MKTFRLFLIGVLLPAASLAGERLISVTPQDFDGWTVVGVSRDEIVTGPQLSIPADAQVFRDFGRDAVIVHLDSRPVFSESSRDWQILEIGPVALALIRDGTTGRMVLVPGKGDPGDLPWSIPLVDAAGRLDIVFGYDPVAGVGLVAFGESTKAFESKPDTETAEVRLSAGASVAWPIARLDLLVIGAEQADGSVGNLVRGKDGRGESFARLEAAAGRLAGQAKAGHGNGTAGSASDASSTVSPAPVSTLEIFTPPAVRHGRAPAIRAAIAERKR